MQTNAQSKKDASAQLLQRPVSPGYLAEQTAQLAASAQRDHRADLLSVLIFRLGSEWLALSAERCQQVLPVATIHTLPHRSNQTLLGVVNVRGQLLLKVSLSAVLDLKAALGKSASRQADVSSKSVSDGAKAYPRAVVIERKTESGSLETWVFDADELYGIYAIAIDQLEHPAGRESAADSASNQTCVRHIFSWREQKVSFLDDSRLFKALRQQAL
ncbi:MAG: chemotaxis protein CheW [Phormidesmis sp.]